MAEVETWFGDVLFAARQLLQQAADEKRQARVDSRQIAQRCGRHVDEVMRAVRWLAAEGQLKADYRRGAYSDVAEVYWVRAE